MLARFGAEQGPSPLSATPTHLQIASYARDDGPCVPFADKCTVFNAAHSRVCLGAVAARSLRADEAANTLQAAA